MNGCRLGAMAACMAISAAATAHATIYTADFEDGVVGSHYQYVAPFMGVGGLAGTIAGDGSNQYLVFDTHISGGNPVSAVGVGPGDTFVLPNGVRAQHHPILMSFDVFVPSGTDFYLNGGQLTLAGGVPMPRDSWVHVDMGHFDRWGSVLGAIGPGLAIDNFKFDDNIQSNWVPEPATWAMMIAGFGMVGAALRRRQARAIA